MSKSSGPRGQSMHPKIKRDRALARSPCTLCPPVLADQLPLLGECQHSRILNFDALINIIVAEQPAGSADHTDHIA